MAADEAPDEPSADGDKPDHRYAPDTVLIALMKNGDRQALGELIRRFGHHVRWGCRSVFTSAARQHDLEEAIGVALTDIVKGAEGFRGTSGSELAGWLRTVSRNASIRVGKRSARVRGHEVLNIDRDDQESGPGPAFDPAEPLEWDLGTRIVDRQRLEQCLDRLQTEKPNHWATVRLMADGHSQAAIADLLTTEERDVSIQDVKNWSFRGRKSLTACLDEGQEGGSAQ